MIRVAIWLSLAASACGRDVYLGELVPPADASIDAAGNGNPFTAGAYGVQFLDPSVVNCSGTLTGQDADFNIVTRTSLGLVDGAVTLVTPDGASLAIAGTPISSRFGESVVTIIPDSTSEPPLWSGEVDGSFDTGPDATICQAIALAADPATATTPSGIQGAIAFLFATSDANGACSLTFGALFTKS